VRYTLNGTRVGGTDTGHRESATADTPGRCAAFRSASLFILWYYTPAERDDTRTVCE
jgi:hypothetical protein